MSIEEDRMLKYCFSIIISAVLASTAIAADKIYLNNGLIIDGIITQIDVESVTIKYGDKDLIRTLHKDAIKVIIYEDGTAETFQKTVVIEPNQDNSRNDRLEQRAIDAEVKAAKNSGIMRGIGFCIVLVLFLAIV